jgi:hypothetical protein
VVPSQATRRDTTQAARRAQAANTKTRP